MPLKIKLLALVLMFASAANAQFVQPMGFKDYSFWGQVNIGNNGAKVTNPSAYLEIGKRSGSLKGILFPRGNKDSIASPAIGLIIDDVPSNKLKRFNGITWEDLGVDTIPLHNQIIQKLDNVQVTSDSIRFFKNGVVVLSIARVDPEKVILNQYDSNQVASAWIDSLKAQKIIIGNGNDSIPQKLVVNNPSQKNLWIGQHSFPYGTYDDSTGYNVINVVDTVTTSFATGEYHRPARFGLFVNRDQHIGAKNLSLEDGWSLFAMKNYILDYDSAHLSPSTSDFVGGTKNLFRLLNTTGQKRVITSGDAIGDANAGFISSTVVKDINTGSSIHLGGYWAGITSYLYGQGTKDTIDNWTSFYSTNAGGVSYVKKYVHFGSQARYTTPTYIDSLWFLKQYVGEGGYNYLDGNTSLGGGKTGTNYRLDVSGTTRTDSLQFKKMTTDSLMEIYNQSTGRLAAQINPTVNQTTIKLFEHLDSTKLGLNNPAGNYGMVNPLITIDATDTGFNKSRRSAIMLLNHNLNFDSASSIWGTNKFGYFQAATVLNRNYRFIPTKGGFTFLGSSAWINASLKSGVSFGKYGSSTGSSGDSIILSASDGWLAPTNHFMSTDFNNGGIFYNTSGSFINSSSYWQMQSSAASHVNRIIDYYAGGVSGGHTNAFSQHYILFGDNNGLAYETDPWGCL